MVVADADVQNALVEVSHEGMFSAPELFERLVAFEEFALVEFPNTSDKEGWRGVGAALAVGARPSQLTQRARKPRMGKRGSHWSDYSWGPPDILERLEPPDRKEW